MSKWVLSNPCMILSKNNITNKTDWPQIPIHLQVWKGTCFQNPKPDLFSLLFKASSVSVPLGQLSVSGNPSAIMLFYRAVRGGCLETAALSCPDNISLCVVHHTPTYLSLGQIALPELENFERLHICSFWILGLLAFWAWVEGEKVKKISCPPKILVELFVKVVFISIYRISKKIRTFVPFQPNWTKENFSVFWNLAKVYSFATLFSVQQQCLTEKAALATFKVFICRALNTQSPDHVSAPRTDKRLRELGCTMSCLILLLCTEATINPTVSRKSFRHSYFHAMTHTTRILTV